MCSAAGAPGECVTAWGAGHGEGGGRSFTLYQVLLERLNSQPLYGEHRRATVSPPRPALLERALPFQDTVLNIINQIMDVCIPQDRAPRDFCVKFPEEIRHDSLAGQLWFGAEVAAAARLQGHGVGVVQPFLCQPGSALEHGPDRGVWGAPVGWAGRGQEAHDPGPVGPPLLPAPGA